MGGTAVSINDGGKAVALSPFSVGLLFRARLFFCGRGDEMRGLAFGMVFESTMGGVGCDVVIGDGRLSDAEESSLGLLARLDVDALKAVGDAVC